MFIEVSAKTGINIKQLFKDLATSLPGIKTEEGESESTGKIQLQGDTKKPDLGDKEISGLDREKKKCCGG